MILHVDNEEIMMFDKQSGRIGLRPVNEKSPHAYRVMRPKSGGAERFLNHPPTQATAWHAR